MDTLHLHCTLRVDTLLIASLTTTMRRPPTHHPNFRRALTPRTTPRPRSRTPNNNSNSNPYGPSTSSRPNRSNEPRPGRTLSFQHPTPRGGRNLYEEFRGPPRGGPGRGRMMEDRSRSPIDYDDGIGGTRSRHGEEYSGRTVRYDEGRGRGGRHTARGRYDNSPRMARSGRGLWVEDRDRRNSGRGHRRRNDGFGSHGGSGPRPGRGMGDREIFDNGGSGNRPSIPQRSSFVASPVPVVEPTMNQRFSPLKNPIPTPTPWTPTTNQSTPSVSTPWISKDVPRHTPPSSGVRTNMTPDRPPVEEDWNYRQNPPYRLKDPRRTEISPIPPVVPPRDPILRSPLPRSVDPRPYGTPNRKTPSSRITPPIQPNSTNDLLHSDPSTNTDIHPHPISEHTNHAPIIKEKVPEPPPPTASPSNLALAMTRYSDLTATMEFQYAKYLQLTMEHEIRQVNVEVLKELPIGREAFQDELDSFERSCERSCEQPSSAVLGA